MTETLLRPATGSTSRQPDAIASALARIAPAWPLDSQLASSPYWGLHQQPFASAAGLLQRVAASPLHMPVEHYRAALDSGEISLNALQQALDDYNIQQQAAAWLAATADKQAAVAALPLQSELRTDSAGHSGLQSWRSVIIQQVSQCCAAWFDRHQAEWQPDRDRNLYQAWREEMLQQPLPTPQPAVAASIRHRLAALPASAQEMIDTAMAQLQPAPAWQGDWLHALLLRNGGWAAWCRYLGWQRELLGEQDSNLHALLAIQLAWETLLDDGARDVGSHWQRWQSAWQQGSLAANPQVGLVWQRAAELATHLPLLRQLQHSPAMPPAASPAALHAVFCIDVRSEAMRRALESRIPGCSTSGFAGFFGLPLAIHHDSAGHGQARLPGLLAPQWDATLPSTPPVLDSWQHFERAPLSSFTLVESTGLAKLGKLFRKSWPRRSAARLSQLDPWLQQDAHAAQLATRALDMATICAQLQRLLPAMGLGTPLPDTILLVGHASHSSNNPHASSLQCGACGGHGGHLHVMLLAEWLNRDDIRQALAANGVVIPARTSFLPALHLTHSDELQLLTHDKLPPQAQQRASALRPLLADVEATARRERAVQRGDTLPQQDNHALSMLRERGHHWAETRPEWGLANNAFFIAAPRSRTRGLSLGGRAFLQEYHWQQDTDGSTLAGILAGPLVVAHWINMQYYAAVCDPQRFGSGNKVLHNVVGGRIGVFEGNSGDLRIGLSRQSVHDGQQWRHQALRLAVCIDAPPALLDAALARVATVQQLVANDWLYLYSVADGQLLQKTATGWQPRQA